MVAVAAAAAAGAGLLWDDTDITLISPSCLSNSDSSLKTILSSQQQKPTLSEKLMGEEGNTLSAP
jgi:hypothetical protein